jgi:hypothetical protein
MIRLPSLFRDYDLCWSGDSAIRQPPPAPADDATDEQRAAYKLALADYERALEVARETGNWPAVTLENQVPAKFVMRQVDRNAWRALADLWSLPRDNPRRLGDHTMLALVFRLALKNIVGVDGLEVRRSIDPRWEWEMADANVVTLLDTVSPSIVTEIGSIVLQRLLDLPKS